MNPSLSAAANPTAERWAEGPTILASVLRYRWLVLAATVVLGTAGFVISQAQPEVYEASSEMFLTNPESSGVFGQTRGTDLDRYLPQQAERVTSSTVLASAAEMLGDDTSPGDLQAVVDAEADLELATITVSATAGSAERVAEVVNTVVAAYEDSVQTAQLDRVERAIAELREAADDLEVQISELQAQAGPAGQADPIVTGQIGVLSQRLAEIDTLRQQLEVDARVFGSGVEFVEPAQPPGAPIAPNPRRTAAVMGLLGALLASAGAYWLAGRGRRVVSRDDPAQVLDVPLLGSLPTYAVADRGTLRERTSLEPRTAEAYRFVYSSLEATLRGIGATSVMVTSASPSTGKTETALQIAATAHRRGRDVLLIDTDLRMQGLTRYLRAERVPGLRDLADQTHVSPSSLVGQYPLGDHRELSVLTSGQLDRDGNQHLSETWFGNAFQELVQNHDLTVIDSPPLLAVADAAMVAGYTDAIVLVVREGSDLDELERVKQRLRFVGQRLVGYIYLSPSALDDTAFDYGLVRSKARETLTPQSAPRDRTETVRAQDDHPRSDHRDRRGSSPQTIEHATREPGSTTPARTADAPGDDSPEPVGTDRRSETFDEDSKLGAHEPRN